MFATATLLLGAVTGSTPTVTPRSVDDLRAKFGVTAFDSIPTMGERLKQIKVAVLDNGFGSRTTLTQDLPESVFKLVASYDKEWIKKNNLGDADTQNPLDDTDVHGRQMAMLAWAMTGLKTDTAPQFLLMNANGFSNLTRAVKYCVENKVDIILYSQNWEYGGNFDGRGFLNRVVSQATSQGILWVNAAGNYAGKVHNATVAVDSSDNVKLGKEDGGLRIKSRLDRNPVKIVLSWNSNSEDEAVGTDKDLDLFLSDEKGNVVAKSEFVQVFKTPNVDRKEGESYVAREMIETDLAQTGSDYYRVKVVAKSKNFNAADKLRITVVGQKSPFYDTNDNKLVQPVELMDVQDSQEIMIPADHPQVIAVGDLTPASSRGPTMDGRTKPDVVLRYSDAEFTDGEGFAGTSNAAAFFAGILAVTKAYVPNLTREMVLEKVTPQLLSKIQRPGENKGIEDLGIDNVRKIHPTVFKGIDNLLAQNGKSPILLAGKYKKGTYIAAISTSPLLLNRYFKHLPSADQNPEHYEVYMAEVTGNNGRPAVWTYVRDRANGPGDEAWEKVLKEKPELFVQIVMAKKKQKLDKDPTLPLWETPAPAAWTVKPAVTKETKTSTSDNKTTDTTKK